MGKKRLGLREKYSDEKVVFVCQNLRMCVRIGMDFRVSSHSTELGMIWNREMGGTKVMETEKQAKIDQHYVPRFYLKNFALVKGTGRKEKAFISFYQFDDEIYKEHIPTKAI